MTKRLIKRITVSKRSQHEILHIEAPGCMVNIQHGLHDAEGREVTRVEVIADGARYSSESPWWVEGKPGADGMALRIVRCRRAPS